MDGRNDAVGRGYAMGKGAVNPESLGQVKQCNGKRRYTEHEARVVVARMATQGFTEMNHYWCRWCHWFHVGHTPRWLKDGG